MRSEKCEVGRKDEEKREKVPLPVGRREGTTSCTGEVLSNVVLSLRRATQLDRTSWDESTPLLSWLLRISRCVELL